MDTDDVYDEIPITEEEPEAAKPAPAPAFDMRAFAQEMARANAEAIKEALSAAMPKPEPAKPRGLGDTLRDKVRESLGLDGDVAERYTRAAAYDTLADEFGDDPAVRKAIAARSGDARVIEAMGELRRYAKSLEERINKREADEQARANRAAEIARLEELAQKGDLGKLAPNLFSAGKLSPAHKRLIESLDVDTLSKALPIIDELIASARPRSKRLGAAPGGTGREKPQPFKVVSDAQWDEIEQRRMTGEEMN
jgi:hypothetical protein